MLKVNLLRFTLPASVRQIRRDLDKHVTLVRFLAEIVNRQTRTLRLYVHTEIRGQEVIAGELPGTFTIIEEPGGNYCYAEVRQGISAMYSDSRSSQLLLEDLDTWRAGQPRGWESIGRDEEPTVRT